MCKRGEVYFCDLEPEPYGHEQGGMRPVVILQNNTGNRYSPTVIIACMTRADKHNIPTHVTIPNAEFIKYKERLKYPNSLIMLEQIRTIDKRRLSTYLGKIPEEYMTKIDKALAISVGLVSLN